MPRRDVLLSTLAAAMPAGPRARLRPGQASGLGFTPLPGERVAFRATGIAGSVIIPVARASIRAVLKLADREVALLSFAADPGADGLDGDGPPGRLDMAAIVGWDGMALRLLALEPLRWQADPAGPTDARLNTRFAATGDRCRLLLQRDAAAPRGALPMHHESWTDLLAWRDGGALADAPAHPSAPGSWQWHLAAARARMIARLARPCDAVTDDVLALCRPPDLGSR